MAERWLHHLLSPGRHFFVGEFRNACAFGSVLHGDSRDSAQRIEVKQRVLVKSSGFHNGDILELNVQSIGVNEVSNFHGLNPLSKKAL
jgi:hypothetical protein